MGSCRARSVYLTTRLLDRLSLFIIGFGNKTVYLRKTKFYTENLVYQKKTCFIKSQNLDFLK